MVTLSCTATREDGVTLVTGRIENAGESRRIRLRSRLDGPLWPPRRRGVPAAGWDDEGFECRLAAGETRPIGAASPAPPADPPLEVAETEPVDPVAGIEPRVEVPSVEPTAEGVIRGLGTPKPPRDAVPVDDSNGDDGTDAPARTDPDGVPTDRRTETASIDADLDAVAARVEAAEQLSETTRLAVATDVLDDVGGVAGVRELDACLSEDAERLDALARRASALAERAEAATVPVERLDRVR